MEKKYKFEDGKKIFLFVIRWGGAFMLPLLLIFILMGWMSLFQLLPVIFILGIIYGLVVNKFDKHKLFVESFMWVFVCWVFLLFLFIFELDYGVSIFLTSQYSIYFRIVFLLAFFIFSIVSLLVNFVLRKIFMYINFRVKENEKIVFISFFIVKFIIMGSFLCFLVFLIMIPLNFSGL